MDETSGLSRRELMGSAAAAGLAAASAGGFGAVQAAAPPAAGMASVHLDVPVLNRAGASLYRPPTRSVLEAGLADPHDLA